MQQYPPLTDKPCETRAYANILGLVLHRESVNGSSEDLFDVETDMQTFTRTAFIFLASTNVATQLSDNWWRVPTISRTPYFI